MSRSGWKRLRAAVALVCAGATIVNPSVAMAFKAKAHVGVANVALSELDASFRSASILGLGPVPLWNDEVMDAVRAYPEYFRAGALGPDSFPDMVGGQLWVHVNNGCEDGVGCEVPANVPLQERTVGQWRSIDYGMYQLRRATQEPAGPGRQQALAFSYGYLAHQMSDGFAHAWLNDWTRDYFTIFEGSGLFGPATEEIQHIVLESYLDKHLLAGTAEPQMKIGTPVAFLNRVYLEPINDGAVGPWARAGSFAGLYYEKLIGFRDLMFRLADHDNWAAEVDAPGKPLIRALLDVHDKLYHLRSLGTDILNPIADIEDYFRRRGVVFDTLLHEWVALSGCVAQNLAAASALPPGALLTTDACKAIDFEPTAETRDLFEGDLNDAAYYGEGESPFDFGSLPSNAKKILRFIQAIADVGVRLSITEDVASVRKVMDLLKQCDTQLVKWKTCEQACNWANATCTKLVTKAVCLTCPTKGGHYNCGRKRWGIPDWRMVACGLQPHCFACASGWLEEVVDEGCLVTRDANMPLCALCADENAVCKTLELSTAILQVLPNAIDKALQPLVDRVKDEIVDALLRRYFGPELQNFYAAFKVLEDSARQAKPAWLVNIAFLREDVKADPAYLNALLTDLLHLGGTVVDNSLEVGAAAAQTATLTASAGRELLKAYITCSDLGESQCSEQAYDRIWAGVVDVLFRIARNPEDGLNIVSGLESPAFAWLDSFRFRTPRATYDRRFAKFLALAAEIQLLGKIRGPTLKKFRTELGLDPSGAEGEIAPHAVHVTHNAVELVKLGFLGGPGIDALLDRAGDRGVPPALPRSTICGSTRHIACDAIQSLDDPSMIRFDPRASSELPQPDPGLAVARWYSNKVQWSPGRISQDPAGCRLTQTDFELALTRARVAALYDKIFQYPPACRPIDDLKAASPASSTSLQLAWTWPGGDVVSMQLERRSGSGGFVTVATLAPGASGYSDAGLSPDTDYTYRVKLTDARGESRYSNTFTAHTMPVSHWLPAVLMLLE